MASILNNCWIVGDIKWKRDTTNALCAKTKTAARQCAERLLARAEYDWADGGPRAQRARSDDPKRSHLSEIEYARWVAGLPGCSDILAWRAYIRLHDGIKLHGPNGETELIREPSAKARKAFRASKARINATTRALMASAIRAAKRRE